MEFNIGVGLNNMLQGLVGKQAYALQFIFYQKPGVYCYTFPVVQKSDSLKNIFVLCVLVARN